MQQKCEICEKWCASPDDVGSLDDAYCYGHCDEEQEVTHACEWCEKFTLCYAHAVRAVAVAYTFLFAPIHLLSIPAPALSAFFV
jgi:hypothetical protein